VPAPARRIGSFAALVQACNHFYKARLNAELDVWGRLCGAGWASKIKQLIQALDGNQTLLLRVGRHSGAENVTLDGWRCIQIRGARGERRWGREATTIWLATEDEDGSSGMLPFGWILAERADSAVPDTLQRWCEAESKRWVPALAKTSPSARPSQRGGLSQYNFRKGDRVIKGEEEATVVRDVRFTDTRMDVRYDDGDINEVSVAGWRIVP
jgi:hypothetical protein